MPISRLIRKFQTGLSLIQVYVARLHKRRLWTGMLPQQHFDRNLSHPSKGSSRRLKLRYIYRHLRTGSTVTKSSNLCTPTSTLLLRHDDDQPRLPPRLSLQFRSHPCLLHQSAGTAWLQRGVSSIVDIRRYWVRLPLLVAQGSA